MELAAEDGEDDEYAEYEKRLCEFQHFVGLAGPQDNVCHDYSFGHCSRHLGCLE